MSEYTAKGSSYLKIDRFTVGPFAENSYLIRSDSDSVLVDPGFYTDDEFEQFLIILRDSGCRLSAVVLTHAHIDHLLGLHRVLKELDVPVCLNHTNLVPWKRIQVQAQLFGLEIEPFPFLPDPLPAGELLTIGTLQFKPLFTPGHSPDHVSLYFQENRFVISGDVIFRGGIGRTDLYGGDMSQLENSIRSQLYTLPDDTKLYPGHGPDTTVGIEKRENPYVSSRSLLRPGL